MLRLVSALSICAVLMLAALTTGCGYKDDLYLPDQKQKTEKPRKNQ